MAAVAFSLTGQVLPVFIGGYLLAECLMSIGIFDSHPNIDGGVGHVLLISPAGNLRICNLFHAAGRNSGQRSEGERGCHHSTQK